MLLLLLLLLLLSVLLMLLMERARLALAPVTAVLFEPDVVQGTGDEALDSRSDGDAEVTVEMPLTPLPLEWPLLLAAKAGMLPPTLAVAPPRVERRRRWWWWWWWW